MKTAARVLLLLVGCPLFALAAMLAGIAIRSGDVVWLCAVLAMTWAWCALVFRGKWNAVPITIGAVVILAHTMGWKVYGRPLLDSTPVLDHALELKDIEPPNIVIAADGSRHALRGFFVRPEFTKLTEDERRGFLTMPYLRVRFRPDAGMISGFVVERPILGWCGNTWDPCLFPSKVSAYKIEDMGFSLDHIFDRNEQP